MRNMVPYPRNWALAGLMFEGMQCFTMGMLACGAVSRMSRERTHGTPQEEDDREEEKKRRKREKKRNNH